MSEVFGKHREKHPTPCDAENDRRRAGISHKKATRICTPQQIVWLLVLEFT